MSMWADGRWNERMYLFFGGRSEVFEENVRPTCRQNRHACDCGPCGVDGFIRDEQRGDFICDPASCGPGERSADASIRAHDRRRLQCARGRPVDRRARRNIIRREIDASSRRGRTRAFSARISSRAQGRSHDCRSR